MSNTSLLKRAANAPVLPALIAGAGSGPRGASSNSSPSISATETRAAYGQAAGAFLRWCEDRGIKRIEDVQPVHVAG